MGVKTDVQMFKSWENPLSIQLDLDIFPTPEQTLTLRSGLNRKVQGNGVFYSALLLAESPVSMLKSFTFETIIVSIIPYRFFFLCRE